MWDGGLQDYIHDWWNLMDFVMNSLYLATISLKIVAFVKVIITYIVKNINFANTFIVNTIILNTFPSVLFICLFYL